MKKYTESAKPSDNKGMWWVVNADEAILGRLASQVAACLRGKSNPWFTPHVDTGDAVIVVNAEKIRLTGRKLDQKMYYHHSGYTGGLTETTARKMLDKKPEELIRHAVKGMLPKNKLGRKLLTKLKVYTGPDHPHVAQQPEVFKLA